MMRVIPLLLCAVLLPACGIAPVRIESRALATRISSMPERFIIVAVADDPDPFLARAGSTPHAYGSVAAYGPSVAARRRMRALEREYGLHEVTAWPIEPLRMHCAVIEVPEGMDRDSLLASLSHDRRIGLSQPLQSFVTRSEHYNDPYVELQRGFKQMNVAGAHPWSRGEGVKVAVIDTGADIRHPDLSANVVTAVNFVDADERQFRRDRHGTEIAGIIAAVANNRQGIVGVAPAAHLLLFKACRQIESGDDAARCNSFTLAQALVAALGSGAQIVNLSLGGPPDPLLSALIREGVRRGVLFVGVAASDPGAQTQGFMHQPGVLEVAGSETRDAPRSALFAPGREILTLLPDSRYDFASGPSVATAQVSGVVALLLARKAGLTSADVYRLLRDTSAPSEEAGGPVIDACAALVSLAGRGSCEPVRTRVASRPP
jgi:hypothetical protein